MIKKKINLNQLGSIEVYFNSKFELLINPTKSDEVGQRECELFDCCMRLKDICFERIVRDSKSLLGNEGLDVMLEQSIKLL